MTTMELTKESYEGLNEKGDLEEKSVWKLRSNFPGLQHLIDHLKLEIDLMGVNINYGAEMKGLKETTAFVPYPKLITTLEIESDKDLQKRLRYYLMRNLEDNETTEEWSSNEAKFKIEDLKFELLLEHSKEPEGNKTTFSTTMGNNTTLKDDETLKDMMKKALSESQSSKEPFYRDLIIAVSPTEEESKRIAEIIRSLIALFDWSPEKKAELIQFIKDGKWWPTNWLPRIISVTKRTSSYLANNPRDEQKRENYENMTRDKWEKLAKNVRTQIVQGVTDKLIFESAEDLDIIARSLQTTPLLLEQYDYWDLLFDLIILGHKEPSEMKLPTLVQKVAEAIKTSRGYTRQYLPDIYNGGNTTSADTLISRIDQVLKNIENVVLPDAITKLLLEPHTVGKEIKKEIYVIGGPDPGDEFRGHLVQAWRDQTLTWKYMKEAMSKHAQQKDAIARTVQDEKANIYAQVEKSVRKKDNQKKDPKDPKKSINNLKQAKPAPSNYECPICKKTGHWGVDAGGNSVVCPDVKANPKNYESGEKKALIQEVLDKRKAAAVAAATKGRHP